MIATRALYRVRPSPARSVNSPSSRGARFRCSLSSAHRGVRNVHARPVDVDETHSQSNEYDDTSQNTTLESRLQEIELLKAELGTLEHERNQALRIGEICAKRTRRLTARLQELQSVALMQVTDGDESAARDTLKIKFSVEAIIDRTRARAQTNFTLAERLEDVISGKENALLSLASRTRKALEQQRASGVPQERQHDVDGSSDGAGITQANEQAVAWESPTLHTVSSMDAEAGLDAQAAAATAAVGATADALPAAAATVDAGAAAKPTETSPSAGSTATLASAAVAEEAGEAAQAGGTEVLPRKPQPAAASGSDPHVGAALGVEAAQPGGEAVAQPAPTPSISPGPAAAGEPQLAGPQPPASGQQQLAQDAAVDLSSVSGGDDADVPPTAAAAGGEKPSVEQLREAAGMHGDGAAPPDPYPTRTAFSPAAAGVAAVPPGFGAHQDSGVTSEDMESVAGTEDPTRGDTADVATVSGAAAAATAVTVDPWGSADAASLSDAAATAAAGIRPRADPSGNQPHPSVSSAADVVLPPTGLDAIASRDPTASRDPWHEAAGHAAARPQRSNVSDVQSSPVAAASGDLIADRSEQADDEDDELGFVHELVQKAAADVTVISEHELDAALERLRSRLGVGSNNQRG